MKKSTFLYDSRFISIVDILRNKNLNLSIYLVRLLTGFGLSTSKKYIYNTERFLSKSKNRLQYID